MPAGYSKTPLAKKLGIRPGVEVVALGAPEGYRALLEPLPEGVTFCDELGEDAYAFIHFFTASRDELARSFAQLKSGLCKDGILWVSWPKKSSKLAADLAREAVREIGLDHGLVDTKVCAVDEDWSGLKFVYRVKDR